MLQNFMPSTDTLLGGMKFHNPGGSLSRQQTWGLPILADLHMLRGMLDSCLPCDLLNSGWKLRVVSTNIIVLIIVIIMSGIVLQVLVGLYLMVYVMLHHNIVIQTVMTSRDIIIHLYSVHVHIHVRTLVNITHCQEQNVDISSESPLCDIEGEIETSQLQGQGSPRESAYYHNHLH